MQPKLVAIFLPLVWPVYSHADELSFGYGPTYHLANDASTDGGRVLNLQYVFDGKWAIDADYFSEQRIFANRFTVEPYGMLTLSRRWAFSPLMKRFPRIFQLGIAFTEGKGCRFDGTKLILTQDCNALAPSPVSISIGLGLGYKQFELLIRHVSNAGLSKPNFGQDSLILKYSF